MDSPQAAYFSPGEVKHKSNFKLSHDGDPGTGAIIWTKIKENSVPSAVGGILSAFCIAAIVFGRYRIVALYYQILARIRAALNWPRGLIRNKVLAKSRRRKRMQRWAGDDRDPELGSEDYTMDDLDYADSVEEVQRRGRGEDEAVIMLSLAFLMFFMRTASIAPTSRRRIRQNLYSSSSSSRARYSYNSGPARSDRDRDSGNPGTGTTASLVRSFRYDLLPPTLEQLTRAHTRGQSLPMRMGRSRGISDWNPTTGNQARRPAAPSPSSRNLRDLSSVVLHNSDANPRRKQTPSSPRRNLPGTASTGSRGEETSRAHAVKRKPLTSLSTHPIPDMRAVPEEFIKEFHPARTKSRPPHMKASARKDTRFAHLETPKRTKRATTKKESRFLPDLTRIDSSTALFQLGIRSARVDVAPSSCRSSVSRDLDSRPAVDANIKKKEPADSHTPTKTVEVPLLREKKDKSRCRR
ncbi:hypothetical protein BDY21DRAFT_35842 [Lineolata rhizophorae]|uniref:Uncharacterized protein n=1 Tax=Lineolata rhizophorae TaxID=578093 RepID=A0A6A6NZR0_9PEZI|nr:hypothetical protein BDY21DRAFT_35842 [Lineolata rhizophorae]